MASNFDDPTRISEHVELKTSFGDGVVHSTLPAGTLLDGQFKVIYEIGSGGMGTVYKCEDTVTGRNVAVKVLSTDRIDAKVLSRFQREAKAIARLDNANLVRLYSVGTSSDGKPFIVMELVEGMSIAAVIETHGPMDEKRVKEIALQICAGLQAAHEMGVVHRDLKPGNIILKRSDARGDDVKIIDFGIAKVADNNLTKATSTGELIGSPAYMSPEQVRGQEVDALTDQYSLGCVLFEMLTGQTPFASSTAIGVLMQHMNDRPPSLSEATLGKFKFSQGIERIIERLLEKDPKARFSSMNECARALRGEIVLAPESSGASTAPSEPKLATAPISNKMLALVATLCAIAGTFYIVNSTKLEQSPSPNPLTEPRPPVRRISEETFHQDAIRQAEIDTTLALQTLRQNRQSQSVDLKDAEFTEKNCALLSSLPYIRAGRFVNCHGTDNVIKMIAHAPLTTLSIENCQVSPQVLKSLESVPTLKKLFLKHQVFPAEIYDMLGRMTRLTTLELNYTGTTNADFGKLSQLHNLVWLTLDKSLVDNGLLTLKAPSLEKLSLIQARVSNKVLSTMNFPSLKVLTLNGTNIDDKTFLSLRRFKKLKEIQIIDCPNVSPEAVNQLKPYYKVMAESPADVRRSKTSEANKDVYPIIDGALKLDAN